MKKIVIIAATLIASAAVAQTGQQSGDDSGLNPNETICRFTKDTGTRLGRTKVCMSREQWAQQRRDTKQNVERMQTQRVEKQF